MPCFTPKVLSVKSLWSLLILFLIAAVLVATPFVSASGTLLSSGPNLAAVLLPQGETSVIRQIPLKANQLVFSPSTHLIYASLPSSAGPNGNSITSLDPVTGSIDAPVFIGSEPTKLALADDGQSLYASLEGSASIRRFDVSTRTPGLEFPVGQDSFFGTYFVSDFAVAPGNPNLIAVARSYRGTSPPEAGVAVFDNGVQRPTTTPGHIVASDFLSFSASASTLYGGGFYSGLNTMAINASGVTISSTATFSAGNKIRFDNGRVYSSTGQVIDPASGTLFGTFSGVGSGTFTTDSSVGRAYFLTGGQPNSNYSVTLRAFDINTFLQVGSLTIPGINGNVDSLVRWGSNGLAFRTDGGQLFLIQTTLIPSGDPIPSPTPTPSPTATPTPAPFTTFVRQVPLKNNDIAYSPATQLFYASVPSSVGSGGNSIQPINPDTGALSPSVFIGSEPTKLAMSDDGQVMYAALDGAGAVRRFNVASQTADIQFSLGFGNFVGPLFANDIAVAPGNPNSVAVSRANRVSSPSSDGVAIYDNGVPRTKTTTNSALSVEFSNTPDKLYSWSSSGVDRLSADGSGVTYLNTVQMLNGGDIRFDGGLLYASNGGVLDPVTGLMKGSFTGLSSGFGFVTSIMTTDVPNGRAFFLTIENGSTAFLRAYNLNNFTPLGSVAITLPGGGSFFDSPGKLVRWGTNGLAFRTPSTVLFIQSALVSDGGVVPSPTPTPSPSPSPTPTPYVPTFVRQINLPANDLVYVSSSQTLYASVPSVAGPNGNSLTQINPQTGTVGQSVFIGSEPNKLALADDNTTLHVSLDGAAAIRRYDIATQTAGPQFSWGSANQRPQDMAVVPGSPQALAISDGTGFGAAIYDNGVQRPNTSRGGAYAISPLAFASASTLYGYDSFSSGFELVKFTVDANGLNGTTIAGNLLTGYSTGMKFAGGLLYSSSGRVVDPETKTIKGTFQSTNGIGVGGVFAVDVSLGRFFTLSGNGSSVILSAFDINTFLPIGSVTLQGISGNPVRLVRWGTNGLAFNTINNIGSQDPNQSKVYIVQSALVSSATPIPTGVQLSADKYFTFESTSNFTFTVTRSGDVSAPTSIDYATSDGSATAGADYTSSSGTLTFAAGQLTKSVPIPILDDNIYEGPPETFNVTLSNPTGGATLEQPKSAIVTINDSESKPTIFVSSFQAAEGDSGTKTFAVPVTLSNASVEPISVNYATEDGTAIAGSDYVANSGVLSFAPGTTSALINITVNGDTLIEPNESFQLKLSNPVNAFTSFGSTPVTITNDDSALQFASSTYSIAEDGNSLLVTVTRTGDVPVTVVNYSTSDTAGANKCDVINGVASSRCDYITTLGTLTFALGETSKTISIPIVDDVYAEGPETFTIRLTDAVGGTVANATATVTINDNESSNGTNPSDAASFFVRQHYIDFLNREPDPGGLSFWTNEITSCGSDANCIEVKRINVSAAFFVSIEFQETGYLVYRVYKTAFGNLPTAPVPIGFADFLKDTQQIGKGVQVGIGPWQSQLESNKQAYAFAFVQRADFQTAYPNTLTAQQFVDQLNTNAGGVLSAVQSSQLVTFLGSTPSSLQKRASVLRSVAEDTDLRAAEFNKAFVLMQYFGYLRRNPNDAPDSDFAGLSFWLDKLNAFGGNYVNAEMVKAFIQSTEYRQRFGP